MEFGELKRILAAFEKEGLRYVLIGSMAMAAQGLVRATRDVDFFVAPDPENVERLRRALRALFDGDPNVDQITSGDLAGDYPAVQYTPRTAATRSISSLASGRLSASRISRPRTSWLKASARVATPRMLYRMKKDAIRPQDRMDAEMIRQRFALEEKEKP